MKHLILVQIKGKLKSFDCHITAGKLCFDFKNNLTIISDEQDNEIKRQNLIEPKVRAVFLPMLEKKADKKLDIFIMNFDFKGKSLIFETYWEDKTYTKTAL